MKKAEVIREKRAVSTWCELKTNDRFDESKKFISPGMAYLF